MIGKAISRYAYHLLISLLVLAQPRSVPAQNRTFDLLTASVTDIQVAVSAGALTYERLVQLYLNRIEAYDKNGPKLNAVLQINPRALEIARALDEERRTKGPRSALHGIPVAVKDSVDVVDMPQELLGMIFECLNMPDLASCMSTSWEWNRAAKDPVRWKR